MTDLFTHSKRRIARAREHIANLDIETKAFFESKPWTSVNEPNPDKPDEILGKIRFTSRFPDNVFNLGEESIEGLRAALDKCAFATAGNPSSKSAYFPIADSAGQLETEVIGRGRCKDIPPDILTFFRAFQPYKGGNNLVWALNKARQPSIHGLFSIAAAYPAGSARLRVTGRITSGPSVIVDPAWNRDKNEIAFFKVGAGSEFEYNLDFSLYVAFNEPDVIRGSALVPTLSAMASEVERIVLATETECLRLGLIK